MDFEEQTKSRPITTVSSALAGLSPGLQASSGSAMPGEDNTTLRVRGVGTMNTASPLVIIDGMEGSLNAVNPLDVENISILKDAASCAIYGARAANGVILVTTKTGTRDKISINYSGRISFNSPTRMIKMMSNYADYMELMNESYRNVGKSDDLFDQKYIDLWREKSKDPNGLNENGVPNYIAYPNTDWAEELFSGGVIHDHNLSVSGGSDKIRFLLSAGYQDNEGVVDNTANKRYSMRANIEANPTKWLTVGTVLMHHRWIVKLVTFQMQITSCASLQPVLIPIGTAATVIRNVLTNVLQPITRYTSWHVTMDSSVTTASIPLCSAKSNSLKI